VNRQFSTPIAAGLALALLALAQPAGAHPDKAPPPSETVSLQGGADHQQEWINDPHMHAFYELTRTAFADGPAKVDVAGFEQKSFAIFREFGVAKGWGAARMQDHLKLIPRQVVQIVKEDPKVLDSYDNFVAATFGPQ
jgi:hypothetical protein